MPSETAYPYLNDYPLFSYADYQNSSIILPSIYFNQFSYSATYKHMYMHNFSDEPVLSIDDSFKIENDMHF